MTKMLTWPRVGAAGLAALGATLARGQEAMYTQAATMPSPGAMVLREQTHWMRMGSSPASGSDHTDRYVLDTSINLGLARALAVTLDVPLEHDRTEFPGGLADADTGVRDLDALFKWRVVKKDLGGIDTFRVALLGGAEMSFEDRASVNPKVGAVATYVKGRHGFDQDLIYTLTTGGSEQDNHGGEGPSDALAFNSAYLFRIAPARYSSTTTGAWYVTAEINGLYETNGDTELRWSPGLMYEGREFGFEIMAQFPLWQNVDHRAELDVALGVGFRVLF